MDPGPTWVNIHIVSVQDSEQICVVYRKQKLQINTHRESRWTVREETKKTPRWSFPEFWKQIFPLQVCIFIFKRWKMESDLFL